MSPTSYQTAPPRDIKPSFIDSIDIIAQSVGFVKTFFEKIFPPTDKFNKLFLTFCADCYKI